MAKVTGRKGALQARKHGKATLGKCKACHAAVAMSGSPVQERLGEHVTVQIAKRGERHTFNAIPKRWVVKRSFVWLEKNRRLWEKCKRQLSSSLPFIALACLALRLKRL